MWKTRVCELLGIEYPIVEGGMTMAGNGELAAAVSNAGGLGMIGMNPGWSPPDEQIENLRDHIRRAKNLTSKPFGVNFTIFVGNEIDSERTKKCMDMAVEEGVKIAACSGGSPRQYTKHLKDNGIKVIHVVGNVRQAKTAEDAGVDIIAAEGYEAGGVESTDELTTIVLIPYVVDAVQVPVLAAGGIADSRSFIAALALGAEGVQIGSRFVAARECHAHNNFKEAIVKAGDTDTFITRRKIGFRIRSLRNEFTKKLEEMDVSTASPKEYLDFIGLGTAREGQMLGDTVMGDMNIGQVAGMINEIVSAEEIVRGIIDGAASVLKRCNELKQL